MINRTVFIGSESPYLDVLRKKSDLQLIVTERISSKSREFFGSSFDYAKEHGIPVISPEKYFGQPPETDLIIVSGYPKLIPPGIIRHPKKGIINIHQSLLPAYRGRHPLNWAIINGEKHTGITIHHINEKFDDGNIICQAKVAIGNNDTIMDIYHKTVRKGAKLLEQALAMTGDKAFKGIRQNSRQASYYPPRSPADGKINWHNSAHSIRNLVRALKEPYPGAYFYYQRKKIVVDEVEIKTKYPGLDKAGKPILKNGVFYCGTGDGTIKITSIRNSAS